MRTVASVAVVADVHGVWPVLEAVLAEPDVAAAELVVANGDLAAGPMPVETLDALTALGERALLVRGNADRELVEVRDGASCPHAWSTGVWSSTPAASGCRTGGPVARGRCCATGR